MVRRPATASKIAPDGASRRSQRMSPRSSCKWVAGLPGSSGGRGSSVIRLPPRSHRGEALSQLENRLFVGCYLERLPSHPRSDNPTIERDPPKCQDLKPLAAE